jgi:redox-sensitive bicupin YhaK (pirin superfamily)
VLAIDGDVSVDGTPLPNHHAAVAGSGSDVAVTAEVPSRVVALGGEAVGPRFICWNFVSSSRDRIEQAKADWMARRFAPVPGDDERIELPA